MSAPHLFLDESKYHGYVIVAGAVLPARLADARRDLRGLVLRGQSRLHFYKESPTRRLILATGARSSVFSAAGCRRDSRPSPDTNSDRAEVITQQIRDLTNSRAGKVA